MLYPFLQKQNKQGVQNSNIFLDYAQKYIESINTHGHIANTFFYARIFISIKKYSLF